MHVLAEIVPLDPSTGAKPVVRASSAQDRRITGLNDEKWWPAISQMPSLGMKLFDGDFSSNVDPGTAAFVLQMDKLARADADVRRYLWAGAKVTLYAGESGDAWPWETLFVGTVDRFEIAADTLKLTAKVDLEPFEADVLTLSYAGTGGLEGDANLKNKVKPLIFGRALNVEPVPINVIDNVFQFSAYGPIEAVNALYERASDFGASIGDYADYAALVAASIPAGRWGTCLAQGLVRLGAPPYGVITGDVDGDKPDGTWIRKTGEIIARAAANAGVDAALIDTASLAALDVAVPYNINIVLTEQVTVLDLARRLARPCNAQAGVSWTGKLFATRAAIGDPAITLDAQGRQRPGVISSVESDVSPPYWRIEMGAKRSWRVHSFDEIAFFAQLVDRGTYSASATYREGNIVQNQGSSWLYTNPAATSGNAPPVLPATSNAYWSIMAEAGEDGQAGDYFETRYIRQWARPSTPVGAEPAGWTLDPGSGNERLWSSIVRKDADDMPVAPWSLPQSNSGYMLRGSYSAAATYYSDDGVTYGGGTYVAVGETTGNAPSGTAEANAWWEVLAAPGAPGEPAVPPSGFSATINLASSASGANLRTLADAAGYTGQSDATIDFVVPAGVTISGPAGGRAIDSGNWPSSSYAIALTLVVENTAIVQGGGGNGGSGGSYGASGGQGGNGGDAITCREDIEITIDAGGTVRAGGGGGGGGDGFTNQNWSEPLYYGGGGGGGGAPNGAGGVGGSEGGSAGAAGTTAGGGAGGSGLTAFGAEDGANGGGFGAAGASGGGLPGYGVRKNGHTVSVINNGTLTGTVG